jgi:hypothetical protein
LSLAVGGCGYLLRVQPVGLGEQGREGARVVSVDVDDLGVTQGSGDQADGAADAERVGHRG